LALRNAEFRPLQVRELRDPALMAPTDLFVRGKREREIPISGAASA
jgi:hypothetical protein